MPTAIGGFTEGLLAGTQVKMAQEQQTEAREQRAWDRNYKQFNSAMQYANKLPAGRRGKFMSDFLNKMGRGSEEFGELANLYSQSDEETTKEINQTMMELNKAKGSGEIPHLQIAKLETLLGKDSPTVVAFKESFKIDMEDVLATRELEIYDLHEKIVSEASEGGKEITENEAAQAAILKKKYPKQYLSAMDRWSKDKDSGTRVGDERNLAKEAIAAEKGISVEQVSEAEVFEKVKELRRALPGEAGEKEAEVQESRRIADLKKTFPKQKTRIKRLNREFSRLDSVIDKAIAKVSPTTAGAGSLLSFVRGSEARDLQNLLNTIKANRGFSNLNQMRADSPTGGALGQVSEMENILLQAVDGSLEPEQSASQLRENLITIKEILDDVREETKDAFDLTYGEVKPGRKANKDAKMRRLEELRRKKAVR